MITTTMRRRWLSVFLLVLVFAAPAAAVPWPHHPEPGALAVRTQAAVDRLGAELGEDGTRSYDALLAEAAAAGEESPHAAAGLAAFLNQQLELATWLYGKGALAEPDNPVYANNFALGLHEKALLAAGGTDRALLELARDHFANAVGADERNAAFVANLGVVELELVRGNPDRSLYGEALYALRIATELDPQSATAWAHYAEALAASGDLAGATEALKTARALAPFNGAVLAAAGHVPAEVIAGSLGGSEDARCKIDYGCDANCPRSIIGQIDLVTCRIAESSAQSACSEGRLYAPAFDCAEKIPEFGILIPGLNSGFSLPTPWGRIDVTVDGAGKVDVRVKWSGSVVPGVSGGATARGTWSPQSGWVSAEIKPGISFSLFGSDAAKLASDMKMGPAQVSIDANFNTNQVEINGKVYGGTVFTH